jgi:hypothetical protein
MRVSGTKRPPYGPKCPRASGKVSNAIEFMNEIEGNRRKRSKQRRNPENAEKTPNCTADKQLTEQYSARFREHSKGNRAVFSFRTSWFSLGTSHLANPRVVLYYLAVGSS